MEKVSNLLKSIFSPASSSEQWQLNLHDFLKGLALATFSAPLTMIVQSLEAGKFVFDWTMIWHIALVGMASYLAKNFLSTGPK